MGNKTYELWQTRNPWLVEICFGGVWAVRSQFKTKADAVRSVEYWTARSNWPHRVRHDATPAGRVAGLSAV